MKILISRLTTIFIIVAAFGMGVLYSNSSSVQPSRAQETEEPITSTESTAQVESLLEEDIPRSTPLPTLTPSRTLKPPPTFQPPTATIPPSPTPSPTPRAEINLSVSIPGLHGAETATPTSTQGCTPREDWTLTYEIQRDDALARIAEKYGTSVNALVEANCINDPNVIVIGQKLRVPGESHPYVPQFECVAWEVLTPMNGSITVEGDGQLTFNWRGPQTPRNLIRITKPDGKVVEYLVELRQNETIDLADIPDAGTHTWYVVPLDVNFGQPCREGGPWTFSKLPKPTDVPSLGE